MTEATSKIITILFAALICVAGGVLAFVLTLRMPPAPAANTAPEVGQILRGMRFEDVAATVEALPDHVVAVWVDPVVLEWPAPATSTGPAGEPEPQAADSDAEKEGPQDDEQPTAQPSAPDQGSATPAQSPYGDRVVRIDDPTQLAAGLDRMPATSAVTTQVKEGMWLTVVLPQTGHSTNTAVTLAAVTALTGAVAALVMVMLWPPRRPRTAGAEPPYARWHPGGGPPSAPDLQPPAAWDAASPASAPVKPQPPPDPQVPALLTQRTTLVRGLADLAAKLPAEFEWQAANVLDSAGVRRIVPDGATFDPAAHHVVGTEPPPNAQLDDTVARTLRPGWADRGQVMVPARVVLYALPEQQPKGQDDDSG